MKPPAPVTRTRRPERPLIASPLGRRGRADPFRDRGYLRAAPTCTPASLARMSEDYEPARYWTDRLAGDYSLRGTGHLAYSARYNRWIYRVKRRALRRGLRGSAAGARALDLGSGTGWVVEQLLDRGLRVDGCDIAANAVAEL